MAALACSYWRWPATQHITAADAALIALLLASGVALGFAGSVIAAGFRCCDRDALGILLGNGARLFEAVLTGALLVASATPLRLCAAIVAARLLALVLQMLWLARVGAWLFAPSAVADRRLVKRLLRPALGFLAFPLGNALVLQGPLLILGSTMGGASVAMFASLRTLARIPMQVTNMFNASVWPELSRAQGAGDTSRLQRLHRLSWVVNLGLMLPISAAQLLLGHWVVSQWLGPSAPYDAGVFAALVLMTALTTLWGSSSIVLMATNKHLRLGAVYIVVNAASMALATALTSPFGWSGLFGPLLLAEAALLAFIFPRVVGVTADRSSAFFIALPRLALGVPKLISERLR